MTDFTKRFRYFAQVEHILISYILSKNEGIYIHKTTHLSSFDKKIAINKKSRLQNEFVDKCFVGQ